METADLMELRVEGMTCTNCANSVKKYLESIGLEDVAVNYAAKEVRFVKPKKDVNWEEVRKGLSGLGYQLMMGDTKAPFWTLTKKWVVSAIFTVPLFLIHMTHMVGITLPEVFYNPWIQMVWCLVPFVIGFFHFGKSAFSGLRMGVPNMDVLIFMGGTASFVYSLIGTLQGNPQMIFFETSAMIFTLVLVGHWIEDRSVSQTTSAIDDLAKLQVEQARMIMPDGNYIMVDRHEVREGDFLQINEGDHIPTDGKIIAGEAMVNEAMISGESIPVHKAKGDFVIGATIVQSGNFRMKVTAVGHHTVLHKIIDLVKNAQMDKPSIQRLADRISNIFVPAVISLALLTILIGYYVLGVGFQQAMLNAIAVLVISCPCAMGLATPTAVMVGVGRMAKLGILVRGGRTAEDYAGIREIVLDKTGTLTSGAFRVQSIQYREEEELVNHLMYQLESKSSHPIAISLVNHLQSLPHQSNTELSRITEEKGQGMQGFDAEGSLYRLGIAAFTGSTESGSGALTLTKDGEVIASIRIEDEIKPDAKSVIEYFREHQVRTTLLSGDQNTKVKEVQQVLGLDQSLAEQKPADKMAYIKAHSKGTTIAMVGDGINDAPALQQATVGIAMSDASKIAMQSANMVMLDKQLIKLKQAHQLSRATLTTIRQNLFWAFAYNVVAIPVAMLGFLNPMWGALFMAFSDLVVIGNSVRLKYRQVI
ncbi:MAG: cadmium-translocating P-type ATPase [Saprospiraceae bacterium]|nr:cadmium-translocating P-type ATPase [Saprospiraceae bacterium]MCB9318792.1 cadmium-translocating P-type ATPase [Lewinellaceae bacterium]